jgi:uncharacterized protein with HEPN domain
MKDTKELLKDMLRAIVTIQSYSMPTYSIFLDDERTLDAIINNLLDLGEAANQVPEQFQLSHPEIPWSYIIGVSKTILHIDKQAKAQIVWNLIQRDLMDLKKQLVQTIL